MTDDRDSEESNDVKRWDKFKALFSITPRKTIQRRDEETGWDRVKSLFRIRYGQPLSEEVKDLPTIVMIASCVGLMFGGLIGSKHASDKFIAINHHSKFSSTMQAQRQMHSAGMLGFVRQGCKWGWKVGLFAGLFSGTSILLTTYRDKDDALNFIAAGGVTGGLFRLRMGVMPTIGGAVLGLLISFPFGLFIDGLSRILIGSEEKKKMREKLYEARRDREKLW